MADETARWKWLRAVAVASLKAGAVAALGVIGASVLFHEVKWDVVAAAAVLAMIVEFLVCVANLPEAPFPANLFNGHDAEEPDLFEDLKEPSDGIE